MKTFHNIIKSAAGFVLLAVIAVSCIPEQQSMGDAGQTLVKLTPDAFGVVALNPTSTSQTLPLFEIRRDVHSQAALNTATTVELLFDTDTAILKAYNEDNETEFIPLPPALHTTSPAISNGKMVINFAPGENIVSVMITVPNAFNFDFSKQYALTYKLNSVSGTGVISEGSSKELVVQVLAKNKYDGIYEVTANSPMVDIVSTSLAGYYPFKYALITTGEHTCDLFFFDWDYPCHPILSGTNVSYYGSFGPQIQFKSDGSGEIVSMTNYWGNPAGNTRGCLLDASQTWGWDPATRNIRVKYYMTMTSAVPTPPHIRTTFDETMKYKGPR